MAKREVLKQKGQVKLEKVGKLYVVSFAPGNNYGISPSLTQAEIWFDEIEWN